MKVAESKLIPEKSRKRYLKEYELFNVPVVNVVCVVLIFFCTRTEKLMSTMFFQHAYTEKSKFQNKRQLLMNIQFL